MENYIVKDTTTVNLGISKFKREIKMLCPGLKRSVLNRLFKAFKKRSWMDYEGIVRNRGSFPTHKVYGKSIKVTSSVLNDAEYEIKVTNGTK